MLRGTILSGARCENTGFSDVDLSGVAGLDSIKHDGPSSIGIDTLFRSSGNIPEVFLRGCGVPDSVIVNRFDLVVRTAADSILFLLHKLQHQ